MGARVGRCIALSSSQTQDYNITRDSVNQGGCRVARPASGQLGIGPFVLPSRPNGCWVRGRTFTVEQTAGRTSHLRSISLSFRVRRGATTSKSGTSRSSSAPARRSIAPPRWGSSLQRSTCHVNDRVGVCGVFLQYLDGFGGRQSQQFDLVTLCLALYFFHHR